MNTLERGHLAPPERTLVEILRFTAATHPDEAAVDDGHVVLTYADLMSAAGDVARRLEAADVGRGDRVGVRVPSGTADLYVAILGVLSAGAAYVPVDADDPEERAALVFGEAGVCGDRGRARDPDAGDPGPPVGPARPGGRRLDHLHLRVHRQAQGRGGHPPRRRRLRGRRGAAVPGPRVRPGAGRAVGRLRRLLRGDVAGLAAR